jgi:Zn-dependent protease with chaperone function
MTVNVAMTTAGFDAFIAERRTKHVGAPGQVGAEHDYSYVSDRQMRDAFSRAKPVELAVAACVRMFKQAWKAQLLGSAVKVSDRQFSRIYALTKHCADTLHIPQPTVYLVAAPTLNAATYGTRDESFIMVHSALVESYSDEELITVIGHECGHIHNDHVVYLTTLRFLTQVAGAFVRLISEPAVLALNAWSRRAEITCDRAGMLCSKDAAVSARALTKLVVGSRKLYQEFDIEAFLEQYQEAKAGVGSYLEVFASHPYLTKRVLAMRAFAESELFRGAAGLGDGGLSIEAVDKRVLALLKNDA